MFEQQILKFLEKHHYTRVTPRAALIDMDGTLYDSMPNHAQAWHRMVTELGIESRIENYYIWEGRTGASVINELFNKTYGHDATADEIKEYYGRKTAYFKELPTPSPMPGAADMLNTLKELNIARVLVTGSGQDSLIGRLNTDFPGAFPDDMRVTAKNVSHGKPHPEPFIKAMQMAHASPSQSLAIDNAPLGIESASRAGAFPIAVVTGPIPAQAMADAGAALIFSSMTEFATLLPVLIYDLLKTSRQ